MSQEQEAQVRESLAAHGFELHGRTILPEGASASAAEGASPDEAYERVRDCDPDEAYDRAQEEHEYGLW